MLEGKGCAVGRLCPLFIAVHDDHVTIGNLVPQIGRFENRQSHIECISVKDAGKTLGDDAGDPGRLDGDRGVFAGRAAPKILAGDDDVAPLDLADELAIGILHAVAVENIGVRGGQVTRRNDQIRIHIIAVFPYFSCKFHIFKPFLYQSKFSPWVVLQL